jgi:hypothetical protein
MDGALQDGTKRLPGYASPHACARDPIKLSMTDMEN